MNKKLDVDVIKIMNAYINATEDLDKAKILIILLKEIKNITIDSLLLNLKDNSKNTDELSIIFAEMAKKEFILDNFKEGMENLEKAIEFADINDEKYLANLYMIKAEVLNKIGKINSAKEWLNKALVYDKDIREKESMIVNEIEK
ncbi:hypothetical protein [Clostridium nigeriense]|uniref:hypothetical protein n=1 Tax=Clostridium nigeriense TaxID=1805470 RepID=UPI000A9B51F6|nr:hypothetical protein [Clostridium nigeriense]